MLEGQTPSSFSSNQKETETVGHWSETSEDGTIVLAEGKTAPFSSNQKEITSEDGSECSFKINSSLEQSVEYTNTVSSELEMPSFTSLVISERSKISQRNPSKDEGYEIFDSTYTARSSVEVNVPPDFLPSLDCVQSLDQVGDHIDIMRGWVNDVYEASLLLRPTSKGFKNTIFGSLKSSTRHIPRDVGVTYEFECSLECLTSYQEEAFRHHQSDWDVVVQHISRIPGLIGTIMLIEDDTVRKRILSYPIVKCAMMNKYSLMRQTADDDDSPRSIKGSWLIDLMEFEKSSLTKVMEYLDIISNITAMDLVPNSLKSTEKPLSTLESRAMYEHKIKFLEQRRELYMAFTKLSHFTPTLLLLSDSQMEHVADTEVINYVVEWTLYQPIGASLVFLDAVSHIIVVISLRFTANIWVKAANHDLVQDSDGKIVLFLFATLGVVYWFFRHLCEAISYISISPKAYFKQFFGFWSLLDLVTLLLSMFLYIITAMAYFINIKEKFPSFGEWLLDQWFALLSILVGMLWLNLLGLFKVLNRKLATMVVAIAKIIKGISTLLVVVVISILASGDMLGIYLSTNIQVCPENFPHMPNSTVAENTSVFCSKRRGASFMAIYNMFIGNVNFQDFSGTWLTTLVFIGLTFFGIIILLNVIIALVCNSYNESNTKKEKLYGRVRLSYVARLIAYEDLIRPKYLRSLSGKHLFLELVVRLIKIAMMLIAVGILISVNWVIYSGIESGAKWVIGIIATMFILLSWLILFSYHITGWNRTDDKFPRLRKFQNNRFIVLFYSPIHYVTRMVLGTDEFDNKNAFDLGYRTDVLVTGTSSNQDQNEIKNSENFEDQVKESFSMIKKQHKIHQDEMMDMKNDIKCLKDSMEEIKEMMKKKFEEK